MLGEPITIVLHRDRPRAPRKGAWWRAVAIIDGLTYQARSRSGAAYELARQLVAAGVPDQPAVVHQPNVAGFLRFISLHRMATRSLEENATTPVRDRRWSPPPDADAGVRNAQKWGVNGEPLPTATAARKTHVEAA
jgi:hypothetical protein